MLKGEWPQQLFQQSSPQTCVLRYGRQTSADYLQLWRPQCTVSSRWVEHVRRRWTDRHLLHEHDQRMQQHYNQVHSSLSQYCKLYTHNNIYIKGLVMWDANCYKLCPQYAPVPPPASWPLTFDFESGVLVTCDVGYLCAIFCLPRPLCSPLRPDVRDRQTSDRRQTRIIA